MPIRTNMQRTQTQTAPDALSAARQVLPEMHQNEKEMSQRHGDGDSSWHSMRVPRSPEKMHAGICETRLQNS